MCIFFFYKEPSIGTSYQVLVHLARRFQRRRFFLENQQVRNKNCLWWPYLSIIWAEMSNLYKGPPIDASYQVSFHLAKRIQRRRFFWKSTNQKQELPVADMFVNGSGRNVQSLKRTFHRCFLPCFDSFGLAVSEETIFNNWPIRNQNYLWWPCLLK